MRLAVFFTVLLITATNDLVAGPAAAFSLQPTTANTGVPFELTVRAIDTSGSTAAGYTGTIHFTSSDAAAVLPADYTFVAGDKGIRSFTVTLHGDHTVHAVTVTDTSDSSLHGTAGVMVKDPDHVVYLRIAIEHWVTREAVTPFIVNALNRDYQPVASYRGTVHFTGDASIELPADYTFTATDAGTHAFSIIFHRGYGKRFNVWGADGQNGAAEVYVLCPDLTLTATNNGPVCYGSPATLSAFTNAPAPAFLWQNVNGGGGPEPNQTGQTVIVTIPGPWEVGMTDGDTGCYLNTMTYVYTEVGPVIDAPGEVYEGEDLTATIATDPDGPYADIEWSVEFGTIVSGQGTLTITVHPNPGTRDVITHLVVTRVATSCRVQSTDYARVVAVPLSAEITTASEVCPNARGVTASVRDAGTGTTYTWTITNGVIASGQATPAIVFDVFATGVVTIGVAASRSGLGLYGEAEVLVGPTAEVITPDCRICSGESETIAVALRGAPPFIVLWSDGVEQRDISSLQALRSVEPDESTTYTLTSVSDAFCTVPGQGSTSVEVMTQPVIVEHPASTHVAPMTNAHLAVIAEGEGMRFEWYVGQAGDRTRLVASGLPTFTTPPLTKTTSYWVSVENECGIEESKTAVVTVDGLGRRRSVRH